MRLTVLVAALTACLCPLAAQADTFEYTFSLTHQGITEAAFTLTSPTLAVSGVGLPTTTCYQVAYGGYPCYAVVFYPERGDLDIYTNRVEAEGYPYLPTEFFEVGDHKLDNYYLGQAELDIVDIPDVSTAVTPEPSSFALLGTGLFGVAAVLRRRLQPDAA